MRKQEITRKPRSRLQIALAAVALSLVVAMALPLTGYLAHDAGLAWAAESDEAAKDSDDVNPRAEYWRAVRQGTEGYSAVPGPEAGVLIQNGGENWRNVRNGPLFFFGATMIIAVLIAIAIKHMVKGTDRLEGGRTGRTLTRWSAFDRVIHWYVAISFIVLTITGLSLLFGRSVLIPLLGKEGFAAWAQIAKPVHDYLALPFAAGLILMFLLWIPKNLFKSYDFQWLKSLGGKHAPAGFMNGGEKVFFWLLFFGGIAITVSGFYLLFPNLGWVRESMQLAHIVHTASTLFLIAISLGHIYLGSVGVEGVLDGMVSGEVDEAFAKSHHNLWYEEVKDTAKPATGSSAADTSTAAHT